MPFPATPSPFRLSRRNPPARRNGPQFAPTPRFLLSQSAAQKEDNELDVIDDDELSSTHQLARTPAASQSVTRSRRRDVIEDSDDAEFIQHTGIGRRSTNELPDDAIDSSPPEGEEAPSILDDEFDDLFAPGNKRRRVEEATPLNPRRGSQLDPILSSPPETANPPVDSIDLPDNSRPNIAVWETGTQRTPAPSARHSTIVASTPGDIKTKTPFRGRPRFMFSSAAKPPSSQPAVKTKQDTPTISPAERQKPVFVLPRSPSPKPDEEDIPAPFSPSARTLHRRGRNRAGVSNYIPGGMAAQVRSWVLEVGAKREQLSKPLLAQIPEIQIADASQERSKKHFVTARIIRVSQSSLSTCGSIAFLQAEVLTGDHLQTADPDAVLNIMIMGPSRSKSAVTPDLRKGDLVGIHRGLNWNVELGTHLNKPLIPGQGSDDGQKSGPPENSGHAEEQEVWLIAMEWDLIEKSE